MTATVAAHGMNNICTARKASAAAGVKAPESAPARLLPSPPARYRIARVAMVFSLATKLLSRAASIRHPNPIHAPSGARTCPMAAR